MFSIGTVIFFVVLGVFLMVLAIRGEEEKDGQAAAFVFSLIFWVIAVIWLGCMTLGSYTRQINDFSAIKQMKQEVLLYSERRDKLVGIVRIELAKYPQLEKEIIKGIHPQILLQFPVLKSNETIMKTVSEILKLEDEVYKVRANMLVFQRAIYYREISPWTIYCTPYRKFFGEPNPVAGEK